MRKHWLIDALLAVVAACLLSLLVYNLPPVHSRLAWRVDSAQAQIYYYFSPPQEAVFIPQEQQIEAIVQATLEALPTFTMSAPSVTPLPSPTEAGASHTPAIAHTHFNPHAPPGKGNPYRPQA